MNHSANTARASLADAKMKQVNKKFRITGLTTGALSGTSGKTAFSPSFRVRIPLPSVA